MQKNINVAAKESDEKQSESRELEKNWQEIEKSLNYLAKTGRTDLTWQELLGRGNENYSRLINIR